MHSMNLQHSASPTTTCLTGVPQVLLSHPSLVQWQELRSPTEPMLTLALSVSTCVTRERPTYTLPTGGSAIKAGEGNRVTPLRSYSSTLPRESVFRIGQFQRNKHRGHRDSLCALCDLCVSKTNLVPRKKPQLNCGFLTTKSPISDRQQGSLAYEVAPACRHRDHGTCGTPQLDQSCHRPT